MKSFENHVDSEIIRRMAQKNYAVPIGLQTSPRQDYSLKIYENFGEYSERPGLRSDLLLFLEAHQKIESLSFSFWAVFNDLKNLDEDEFELLMRKELAPLSADSGRACEPISKNHCFSLEGKTFFAAGLHPASSRRSRRFPWPALVFTAFRKFDAPMMREHNPMVLLYSDRWENLQMTSRQA